MGLRDPRFVSSNHLSADFFVFFVFIKFLVFSLKKKSHSVILSFIHSFIHLFRQTYIQADTHIHTLTNIHVGFSSAEPNTYRPTQKLKIWVWVGFETTKLSSSQSPLLLAYSFYIHFVPSIHPSFLLSLLTYLLTYNYLHD